MVRTPFALLVTLALATPLAAAEVELFRYVFVPPPAKDGHSYPDCYCTDSEGARVEMGERACLTIGGRQVMATCDMSLNNPTWRTEEEGCPIS